MAFIQLPLPYAQEALEPYISRQTIALHYGKHHRTYVDKLNELIKGTELDYLSLYKVIRIARAHSDMRPIFNNAGQHANHTWFWLSMKPHDRRNIPDRLEHRLVAQFGSVEAFKARFVAEGLSQFGSGWVWLVEVDGALLIQRTSNASLPLAENCKPLMVCDVWEHAYYVDYQNRRADFLNMFIEKLVNWDAVDTARLTNVF